MTNNINRVVILNNVRSSENVGSIFRTADTAGVKKIILCGYTPAPLDRFGRENKRLAKASLGAEKFVEWEKQDSLSDAIAVLENSFSSLSTDKSLLAFSSARPVGLRKARSEKNFPKLIVVAIEQDKNSIDYRKIKEKLSDESQTIALVFGNEVDGLSKEDLSLCDLVAEIPMHGKKESLNVSVSVGVVLFSLS